jgi:nucleoside-diphosphate-sugar epimerase
MERDGAAAIDVDLFDADAVHRAVVGHDAVVNLATHVPNSTTKMFLPWAWRENDEASWILVDASLAADVSRFVQESFAPAYPDAGDHWIDETTPLRPVRYNRSVMDAEASADRFSQRGRTGVVLRFGAFYGSDAVQTSEFIGWVKKGWAPLAGPGGVYASSILSRRCSDGGRRFDRCQQASTTSRTTSR